MVNCPYCKHQMSKTGRTYELGCEYACPNCKAVWNFVEKPDFNVISKRDGIMIGSSIFFPVVFPNVLRDIVEQQPNKTEARRIKKWAKAKRLKKK